MALQSEVQFSWEQTPLRDGVQRLGSGTGVAVVVDRRLDPEATVNLDLEPTPLSEALQTLAELQGWGVSILPHTVYFGPTSVTDELATILALQQDRVLALPQELQRRWTSSSPASWQRLAEPRRLIEERTARDGITLVNADRIPHDVWAEKDLPEMPLLEQLVILLAGFDLAPEIEVPSGHLRIVPLTRGSRISRSYPRATPRTPRPDVTGQDSPRVTISESRNAWTVTGPQEFHRDFADALKRPATDRRGSTRASNPSRKPASRREQRFSLSVKNQPLGAILETLGRQSGLSIDWTAVEKDRYARSPRSVNVQNITAGELLDELFRDLPVQGTIDGGRVRIEPRNEPSDGP